MCSAVIVNRRGNQASKVFFGLVLLMLMIVVSAQDYREANPTVEQTDKRYYVRRRLSVLRPIPIKMCDS